MGLGLGQWFFKKYTEFSIQEKIGELIDGITDAIYPCKLITTIRFNQPQDSHIVDMSKYDTSGIISIIVNKKEKAENEIDIDLDGKTVIYQTAVVYRLGEHWFWKVL